MELLSFFAQLFLFKRKKKNPGVELARIFSTVLPVSLVHGFIQLACITWYFMLCYVGMPLQTPAAGSMAWFHILSISVFSGLAWILPREHAGLVAVFKRCRIAQQNLHLWWTTCSRVLQTFTPLPQLLSCEVGRIQPVPLSRCIKFWRRGSQECHPSAGRRLLGQAGLQWLFLSTLTEEFCGI